MQCFISLYITMNSKYRKGFTLIELLVVIAIIGLLANIILASLFKARIKGYDAQRTLQMKNMETALERYYIDNETYPPLGITRITEETEWNALQIYLQPYLPELPNPTNSDDFFNYAGPGTFLQIPGSPKRCIATMNSYYLWSVLLGTQLAQNDGGLFPGSYEIFGSGATILIGAAADIPGC